MTRRATFPLRQSLGTQPSERSFVAKPWPRRMISNSNPAGAWKNMCCDLIFSFSLRLFARRSFFHIFASDAEAVAGDASDDFIGWCWGRIFDLPDTRLLGG